VVLLKGYLLGIVLAFGLTSLAVSTQLGRDLLGTLTSMFNPLPAIALLPLALLWFGLGDNSLIFVLVHSVLWALALNTYAGFLGVSKPCAWPGATMACAACAWCCISWCRRRCRRSCRG
jgi:NitT/TauT family transport system permease protein